MDTRPPRKAAIAAAAASAPHKRHRNKRPADDDGGDQPMDHVDDDGEEDESEGEDEAMAENVSSSSEEGSDWEDIARGKRGAAAKKKQRLDANGRAAGVAVAKRGAVKAKAKAKAQGRGRAKAKATATGEEGDQCEEGENGEGGVDGDVDMEDVAEKEPEDALAALNTMREELHILIQRLDQTEAKARQVFEAKNALPPPNTDVVERQCRVWTSMVMRNTKMQIDNAKGTATAQLNQTVEKLDIIEDGINKINQPEQGELACLEGLPEGLWLSDDDRIGTEPQPTHETEKPLTDAVHSFLSVCRAGQLPWLRVVHGVPVMCEHALRALTSNSAMHHIVEVKTPPPDDSIDLLQERLSACRELRVRHSPCAAMVRLLEALSATIVTLTLQGSAPSQQEITRTDAKRGRHQRGKLAQRRLVKAMRRGKVTKVELPSSTAPVVFPRLRKATIYNAWGRIAGDRNYTLPALKELNAVSLGYFGPLLFIRRASAGVASLHITHDEDVVAHAEDDVTLHAVVEALRGTPTAETLVSLTGRVQLDARPRQLSHLHPQPPPLSSTVDRFVNMMSTSRLQRLQLGVGPREIQSAADIQNLHRIRTSCLAPNATEDYYRVPTHDERRYEGIRGPIPDKPHIRLPITGTAAELGGAVPTFQLLCAHSREVTLEPHGSQGAVREAPGLDDLVCTEAKKLTIRPSGASQPLPPYVIGSPASLFPAVESVEVRQDFEGMAFYDGGVGTVLGDLPSLESVTFRRDVSSVAIEGVAGKGVANGPQTTCRRASLCLVPAAVGFLSAEGTTALTVGVGFDVHFPGPLFFDRDPAQERWEIKWSVYGQAGEGRETMGRISRIEISLHARLEGGHYGMTEQEGKAMCRSLADAVAEAFSLFPSLRSVSLSGSKPRFPLVPEIREAAQRRFVVVSGKKSAVEMRPTRASSSKGGGVKGKGKKDKATKAG
ncbi:unnamed protein product [Vitrella brassicaformis CCMP3155]|uniref:Uncharacterized protein n=1 Tax=Vitrella brassicaformis (strain CCMP3155) TaxID=1169540 RepID=A0A0G4GTL1_VITBC|nr:unnamed protein product [Vitrella brassicaformis CCMP3155]|eukprot:CEM34084.1 unnamed protein product [Vitrella brassicaformis CCMP3155]